MTQISPSLQTPAPEQVPPQPSLSPHDLPVQSGVQQAPFGWHVAPRGQPQTPPQPSEALQSVPSQLGLQQVGLGPPSRQVSPSGQPVQVPPQPSLVPHALPMQLGVQQVVAPLGVGMQMPFAHVLQAPPQPSSSPHALPVQSGTQRQRPSWQAVPSGQGVAQQLSWQTPLEQNWPGPHLTPAQVFITQVATPDSTMQISPESQLWLLQGSGVMQLVVHVKPTGQAASHLLSGTQRPPEQ
jgi:hypothetical protein